MSLNPPSSLGTSSNALKQRYRLPGIIRKGIAQLSILETALWPVQGGKRNSLTFDTQYKYSVDKKQQQAQVSVYAPLGLESIDEYILWGLLGMSLSHKQPDPTFLATPYWIIKNLGMSIGGSQYTQLRASLERLALVAYQNTAFYNPVTQEHERMTFRRLSDLSWWMRLLCQSIAIRANAEDGDGLGRFWQGRYKAVRILDEESLLACAAYIDLNPIRAGMAETLEQSD